MVGATIGRFNPPHLEHFELWRRVAEENDEVWVGLLDTRKSKRNPLSYGERKEIIKAEFQNFNIVPFDCKDLEPSFVPASVKCLLSFPRSRKEILEILPKDSVVYTRDFHEFASYKVLGFDARLWRRGDIAGRNIRSNLYRGGKEWRELVPDKAKEVLDRVFPKRFGEFRPPFFFESTLRPLSTFAADLSLFIQSVIFL